MNRGADVARSLYLELWALHLEVGVHHDPKGARGILDYGILVDGLHHLSEARVSSVTRRILANENRLVRLLTGDQDSDIHAFRREGECRWQRVSGVCEEPY
jgi:hypothetical protein